MSKRVFTVGGTVQAGGGVYIARRADQELLSLCEEGRYAYILTTRQVGKSSLVIRTIDQLAQKEIRSVFLDLTLIGTQVTQEEWYIGLLFSIQEQLGFSVDFFEWWEKNSHFSPTDRFTRFFQDVVLQEVKSKLVVCIDEIDTTLALEFRDDFFAAVRSLYNSRSQNPELNRLSFVFIGVATPNDLIRDSKRTPFNIGTRVELTDFTFEEALRLTDGFGLPPEASRQLLKWILDWTGGHPYLTQRLCQAILDADRKQWTESDVAQVVEQVFFGHKSHQDTNLRAVGALLTQRAPDLEAALTTYRRVLNGWPSEPDDEHSLTKTYLKLAGVVRVEGKNLRIRNRIYRKAFDKQWVREHLPVDWRKRFAAVAVAAVLILLILNVPLSIYAWNQKIKAEQSALTAMEAADRERQAYEEAERLRRKAEEAAEHEKAARVEAEIQRGRAEKSAIQERIAKLTAERQRQAAVSAAQRERAAKIEADRLRKEAEATAEREKNAREEADRLQADAVKLAESEKTARKEESAAREEVARVNKQLSARNLAVQAELLTSQRDDQLQTSLMLAVESMKRLPNVSADRVLRVGLKSAPALGSFEARKKEEFAFNDEIHSLAFSPDGRKLAVVEKDVVKLRRIALDPDEVASPSQQTVKGNSDRSQQKAPIQKSSQSDLTEIMRANVIHKGPIVDIAFHPKGAFLAVASKEKVSIWDTEDIRAIIDPLYLGTHIRCIAYGPEGRSLAVADKDKVRILDNWTGREISVILVEARRLSFSPDGYLLAAVETERVSVWELKSGRMIVALTPPEGAGKEINAAAFSPDGNRIATAGDNNYGYVWDIGKGEPVLKLEHPSDVNSIAFSSDGRLIVTTCDEQGGFLWDAASGKPIGNPLEDKNEVYTAVFHPGGSYLAVSGKEKQVVVWQVERKQSSDTEDVLVGQLETQEIVFRNDKELVVKTIGKVRAWDIESKVLLPDSDLPTHLIRENALNLDGSKLFAVGSGDFPDYRVFDIRGKFELASQIKGRYRFEEAFFIANTNKILIVPRANPLQLWDWKSNKLEELPDSGSWRNVTALDFDQTNQRLIVISSAGDELGFQASVYDLPSRKTITSSNFKVGRDLVTAVKFSPDGTLVAVADRAGTVRFLNAVTLDEVKPNQILKHDGAVNAVAFTPDGKYLATASEDKTARIWEIASRREIVRLSHGDAVNAVTFSQSGKYLATGCEDGTVHRYLWRPEDLIDLSCSRLSRPPFTEDEWNQYFEGEKFENYVPCPNQKAAGRQ